jgi:hypothetical protein
MRSGSHADTFPHPFLDIEFSHTYTVTLTSQPPSPCTLESPTPQPCSLFQNTSRSLLRPHLDFTRLNRDSASRREPGPGGRCPDCLGCLPLWLGGLCCQGGPRGCCCHGEQRWHLPALLCPPVRQTPFVIRCPLSRTLEKRRVPLMCLSRRRLLVCTSHEGIFWDVILLVRACALLRVCAFSTPPGKRHDAHTPCTMARPQLRCPKEARRSKQENMHALSCPDCAFRLSLDLLFALVAQNA